MSGDMNPWLMMWSHPRNTIRSLITTRPKYGVFFLSFLYTLQNFLYFSNYWSVGLSFSFYTILIAAILLSPFLGWVWVYLTAWILHFTGKPFRGKGSIAHLKTAAAWSKVPTIVSLVMWFILLVAHPKYVFILDAGGPTALFIALISLALSIWSFVLLVQSLREVQSFSLGKALLNAVAAWVVFSVLIFFFLMLVRYFYTSSVL